jgi:hypothetical protein
VGGKWRTVACSEGEFPRGLPAHTRTQYSYFGKEGLLRRHLYRVDILGGAQGANYSSDYRTIEQIELPTRRRVFGYEANLRKVAEPVLVSIDLKNINFE